MWNLVIAAFVSLAVAWLALAFTLWRLRTDESSAKDALRILPDTIRLLRALASDRAIPRRVRWRIWLVVAYLVIPIDLIPDFVPVIGYADDVIIVAAILRSVVRRAGPDVVARNWRATDAGLSALRRLARLTS